MSDLKEPLSFADFLLTFPGGVDFERDEAPMRDVDLDPPAAPPKALAPTEPEDSAADLSASNIAPPNPRML